MIRLSPKAFFKYQYFMYNTYIIYVCIYLFSARVWLTPSPEEMEKVEEAAYDSDQEQETSPTDPDGIVPP